MIRKNGEWRHRLTMAGLVLVSTLMPSMARAQTSAPIDVAGGYVGTYDGVGLAGAGASVDFAVAPWANVVGMAYRTSGSSDCCLEHWAWNDTFVGGGLRVQGRTARVQPFLLAVVGGLHVNGEGESAPTAPAQWQFKNSTSETVAAGIFGGGVLFRTTPRVGVRFGGDLQYFFQSIVPQFRATADVVVRLGSR